MTKPHDARRGGARGAESRPDAAIPDALDDARLAELLREACAPQTPLLPDALPATLARTAAAAPARPPAWAAPAALLGVLALACVGAALPPAAGGARVLLVAPLLVNATAGTVLASAMLAARGGRKGGRHAAT